MHEPTVVALNGSLRNESKTRVVLQRALEAAADAGGETRYLDLRDYHVPAYDPDESQPSDVRRLSRAVESADAIALGTPNYHGTFSGVLKNALDHLGRDEFAGSTVGLVEVAGGRYPGSALAHLRHVSRTLNAWTLPIEVAIPSSAERVSDEAIRDEDMDARVTEFGRGLTRYAGVSRYPDHTANGAEPPQPL